jgi:hypothetical protein
VTFYAVSVDTVALPVLELLTVLGHKFGASTGKLLVLKSCPLSFTAAEERKAWGSFWPTDASKEQQEELFVAVQQLVVERQRQELHLDLCEVSLQENCPPGLAALAAKNPQAAAFAIQALNRTQSTFGFVALGAEPTLYHVRERDGREHTISLNPGDLLIMARDAVHAGAFYAGTQYRYYFALVSDSDAAKIDNTFNAPPAPPVS